MSDAKTNAIGGTDWTALLADPVLARNLGKLLQTYRDAAPERREQALLAAMREIKRSSSGAVNSKTAASPQPIPTPASATPPFEPDIFSTTWAQDRRRHPRIKCFVAVELHVSDSATPLWGNLSNTSLGGCQVETAARVSDGSKVEIGLWVASGKIWVKGMALNGVVTRSAPVIGVRIRFSSLDAAEKENLRQFLRYVQDTTKAAKSEKSYLQLLK
ncbi:MAG TPA: PilZ domain-containing protein [Candidatus Acidoferrum sp.]|nr:PilZ domain-containing protein [Candidatus Acidoferrum sp.]